jgi:hypothetical protein
MMAVGWRRCRGEHIDATQVLDVMPVQRAKSRTHRFVVGDFLVLLVVSDIGVDYQGSNSWSIN